MPRWLRALLLVVAAAEDRAVAGNATANGTAAPSRAPTAAPPNATAAPSRAPTANATATGNATPTANATAAGNATYAPSLGCSSTHDAWACQVANGTAFVADAGCAAAPGAGACAAGFEFVAGGDAGGGRLVTRCFFGAACASGCDVDVCYEFHSRKGRDRDPSCCALEERASCLEGYRYSRGAVCEKRLGCTSYATCCAPCAPGEPCESKSPIFGQTASCANLWGVFVVGASVVLVILLCFISCCCFHWLRFHWCGRPAPARHRRQPPAAQPRRARGCELVVASATAVDLAAVTVVDEGGFDPDVPVASAEEVRPVKAAVRPVAG